MVGKATYKMVEDLVANDLHHLKGLQRRHTVHQHIAVGADHLLRIKDAVFILAGCVDDFSRILLALVLDLLGECALDGRVVALDKVTVDVADRERRFACWFAVELVISSVWWGCDVRIRGIGTAAIGWPVAMWDADNGSSDES